MIICGNKGPYFKLSRAKVNTFLDQNAQSLKYVPGPTKYGKLSAWGHRYSGKFNRQKKISMSQFYIDHSNDTPAANSYKVINKIKIRGSYRNNETKDCFIDTVQEEKKILPAPNKYTISLKYSKPRAHVTQFYPIKRERFMKIEKNNIPGPTSYESPTAIRKTQWSPPKGKVAMKEIKGSIAFFDSIIKSKKHVPGVGHYKNFEKAFDSCARARTRGRF